MAQLTKQQVIEIQDIKTEAVSVPEWGGEMTVAVMTGPARDEWETALQEDNKPASTNRRAWLCAMCIIDPQTGKPMFTVDELSKKSATALDRVFPVAMRLNKIGGTALGEEIKNSSGPGNDSSGT